MFKKIVVSICVFSFSFSCFLNFLNSKRVVLMSNPDISPTATRRHSVTSFSQDDILSHDRLYEIRFDPRYRDYRSSISLNTNNYRSRSNSVSSIASARYPIISSSTYIPKRVVTPPPIVIQDWDNTPQIFVEEYDDKIVRSSPTKSDDEEFQKLLNKHEALSEGDLTTVGDTNNIPFIDDDDSMSNDTADEYFPSDEKHDKQQQHQKQLEGNQNNLLNDRRNSNGYRKSISFDVIASNKDSVKLSKMFVSEDGNDRKSPQKMCLTNKSSCSHCFSSDAARSRSFMRNVERENIANNTEPPLSPIPTCDIYKLSYRNKCRNTRTETVTKTDNVDHSILVDKLKKFKNFNYDETNSSLNDKTSFIQNTTNTNKNNNSKQSSPSHKIRWDDKILVSKYRRNKNKSKPKRDVYASEDIYMCQGKVKALTTYFDSMRFLNEDCHCHHKAHYQSAPNLSGKLSEDEQKKVLRQLKEWSEFGLEDNDKTKSVSKDSDTVKCTLLKRAESQPVLNLHDEDYASCKSYKKLLNRIDKIDKDRNRSSLLNLNDFVLYEDLLNDDLAQILPDCLILHKTLACNPHCTNIENLLINVKNKQSINQQLQSRCNASKPTKLSSFREFERHRCRSPCFNTKKSSAKNLKNRSQQYQQPHSAANTSKATTISTTPALFDNNNNVSSGSIT